jgi:IS1 family transposase
MNKLSTAKRVAVVSALVEGCSIASTCRLTNVSKMTVLSLLAEIGTACALFHDRWVRDVAAERVQADELWSFVGMKQKNVPPDLRNTFGFGDVWTFVGFDADTKLVLSWLVGSRDTPSAVQFATDLRSRLSNRVQLSTDGFECYNLAIRSVFRDAIDYAQVVKIYNDPTKEERRRYSPSKFIKSEIHKMIGDPDDEHISTSYVERNNLTIRTFNKRMARLTCAFSKKVENHAHQLALNFWHYNFARIHRSLRCTPAMAAGVVSNVWDVQDLVQFTDEQEIMSSWDMAAFLPQHPDILQPEA